MTWLRLGAAALLVSVVLGAFAAHALGARLSPRSLSAFETAVRYLATHGLGLLAIGLLARSGIGAADALGWAGSLMTAGMALFCGSLIWLALSGPAWLGPVTPVGGTLLVAAWGALLFALLRAG